MALEPPFYPTLYWDKHCGFVLLISQANPLQLNKAYK